MKLAPNLTDLTMKLAPNLTDLTMKLAKINGSHCESCANKRISV